MSNNSKLTKDKSNELFGSIGKCLAKFQVPNGQNGINKIKNELKKKDDDKIIEYYLEIDERWNDWLKFRKKFNKPIVSVSGSIPPPPPPLPPGGIILPQSNNPIRNKYKGWLKTHSEFSPSSISSKPSNILGPNLVKKHSANLENINMSGKIKEINISDLTGYPELLKLKNETGSVISAINYLKILKENSNKTKMSKLRDEYKQFQSSKSGGSSKRKSPTELAKQFKIGKIKKGNNGKMWIVAERKDKKKFWKKI